MLELTASEIAAIVHGRLGESTDPATRVTAPAAIDSRLGAPGSLFVAMPGENVDGHEYAAAAIANGSALVLAEREVGVPAVIVPDANGQFPDAPVWIREVPNTAWALGDLAKEILARLRRRDRPRVVAVTGSAGKTTTKDLLAAILSAQAPTVAPVGSFNNHIGLPSTITQVDESTQWLVLEMGANHVGEIASLAHMAPPDVGIELMVGTAHLGEFGSREAIARAKRELVEGLMPTGIAVLNCDDERVMAMAPAAPGRIITFGLGDHADIRGSGVRTDDADHLVLDVTYRHDASWHTTIHTGLVGSHNAHNVLAALAGVCALHAQTTGEDWPSLDQAAETIQGLGPASPHRMAVIDAPNGWRIVDDSYNASPQSVVQAIRTVVAMGQHTGRPVVAVLGEMSELGQAAPAVHGDILRQAAGAGLAGLVLAGPVFEAAQRAVAELTGPQDVVCVSDAEGAMPAIQHMIARIGKDDPIVLVKGSHSTGLWRLANRLAKGA